MVQGKSHLWHKKYSWPHTEILGKIGCHVKSKLLGIGSAERAWGDVKHLKKDKPSHMGSQRLSKKVIIYTTASLNESRLILKSKQDDDNKSIGIWGDKDEIWDLGLEKFGSDVKELKATTPKRNLVCWIEEWEKYLFFNNDVVAMTKLKEKYRDSEMFDHDDEIYV